MSAHPHGKSSFGVLALGALGVVFGDIGTSPLYTLRQCLAEAAPGSQASAEDVLGLLSLIFWSLMLVVTLKYITFIMRADNDGEGGIFALLALVPRTLSAGSGQSSGAVGSSRQITGVAVVVVVGAALLYGDGAITPAISVLSAIEGVTEIDHTWAPAVVPITCVILLGLFLVQRRGTGSVGRLFGPVMAVYFVTIAGLGIWHLTEAPRVFAALLPHHGVRFFMAHGFHGFLVLGAVVLAVTGGEALYADMGHFGARPIRFSWLTLVLPALLLCYFGQGAMVLAHPETAANPFFKMVPEGAPKVALILLSSAATVIASQALISGAFSLTRQAQQLGYFPRVTVVHTAAQEEGQIYIPEINWILAAGCLLLVLGFRSSEKLAAAYGIAVTGTMILTSIVFFVVMRRTWKWPLGAAAAVLLVFLVVDVPFFLSNTAKILDGGWVPVLIGLLFVVAMLIWSRGRTLLRAQMLSRSEPIASGLERIVDRCAARVPGTAVFMASDIEFVPPVMAHVVERTRTLHEQVFLLTVLIEDRPHVPQEKRFELTELRPGFKRLIVSYGFIEEPDVPKVLAKAAETHDLKLDLASVTYFLGREAVLGLETGKMGRFTEGIFGFLTRNAVAADRVFNIPPRQAVEVGIQVDL